MIQIIYHGIVLFLTFHLTVYLIRERKFWVQVSTAIVLIMFLLRLFLVK
jgi:hypothetical protein